MLNKARAKGRPRSLAEFAVEFPETGIQGDATARQ
jgi:hypothetical protein